jgi:hypothetical protein
LERSDLEEFQVSRNWLAEGIAMALLGKTFRKLTRSLVPSLFVMVTLWHCVPVAMSHEAAATPAGSAPQPQVFKTVPTGTPTDRPGRGLQFLCFLPLTLTNGGEAPVYTKPTSDWVDGLDVVVSEIPFVEGSVRWGDRKFTEIRRVFTRRFVGNSLPNHTTGEFPVMEGTDAFPYYNAAPAESPYETADQIPITAYDMDITVPRFPVYHSVPTCIDRLVSGVATQTGITWHINIAPTPGGTFADPIAALPPDECFGHPYNNPGQPEGQYHYHGWSWRCFPNQGKSNEHSPLFGYALDGFGIYGPRDVGGKLVTNAELDECHGHFGVVTWEGRKRTMYHYHLNTEFPYGPGCLRGRPLKNVRNVVPQ